MNNPWQDDTADRIYFIAAPSVNMVKIGVSCDVVRRLSELINSSPVPLTLIGSRLGNKKAESYIHRLFASHRAHGEWFHLTSEISEFAEHFLEARPPAGVE